jgi:tripartite-type tricarboxylate transporter receptor subunit TctC
MLTRRSLLLSSAALPLTTFSTAASASTLFSRPLTWVVPYPPGGFGDSLSRVLAPLVSTSLGQTVVVENRPGAGGQIAASFVKQQRADGHTLMYGDIGPFAMNAALYPKLSYDTLKDFTPLTRLITSAQLLVVPPTSPFQSLADLVKASTADKGVLYGSYGMGSHPHIWVEMLKREVQGNFRHVAYKGAAPAMQDLMGGQIDTMLDVAANSLPYVRGGRLRAVAVVGSPTRLESLPQVPTISELGYRSLDAPGWAGVVVRRGTPAGIVAALHAAVVQAVRSDEVRRRFGDLAITPAPQSAPEFAQFIRSETDRLGAAIRAAGVVLE